MSTSIVLIAGTRPEVIKLASLYHELRSHEEVAVHFCALGQHDELLDQALSSLGVEPRWRFRPRQLGRSLEELAASLLLDVTPLLRQLNPSWVVVQGDTVSALVGAYASYLCRFKVAHVEAGLRTYDNLHPWPEEGHRRMITQIATLHFAPTQTCAMNLAAECVPVTNIHVVGNTGIDSLKYMLRHADQSPPPPFQAIMNQTGRKRLLLVSFHRRETLIYGTEGIIEAIRDLAQEPDVCIVVEVHPNPRVMQAVQCLRNADNVILTNPLDYRSFIRLLDQAYIVLSDSGGLQEEAASVGKPFLVLRQKTERLESVSENGARLVGFDKTSIVLAAKELLNFTDKYRAMAVPRDIYGDGTAGRQIADYLLQV